MTESELIGAWVQFVDYNDVFCVEPGGKVYRIEAGQTGTVMHAHREDNKTLYVIELDKPVFYEPDEHEFSQTEREKRYSTLVEMHDLSLFTVIEYASERGTYG